MARRNISTGSPWEKKYGYSRAVRIDPHVWVSGTIAADEDGRLLGAGDPYAQTVHAFRKIDRALKEAGVSLQDVVYVRFYLADLNDTDEVGRARAASQILPGRRSGRRRCTSRPKESLPCPEPPEPMT